MTSWATCCVTVCNVTDLHRWHIQTDWQNISSSKPYLLLSSTCTFWLVVSCFLMAKKHEITGTQEYLIRDNRKILAAPIYRQKIHRVSKKLFISNEDEVCSLICVTRAFAELVSTPPPSVTAVRIDSSPESVFSHTPMSYTCGWAHISIHSLRLTLYAYFSSGR